MLSLSGYQIGKQIYAGARTLVFSGTREADRKPVVIKLLKSKYPSFNELVQFRNQYTIAKSLNIDTIITTYSLENYQNSYALVMEDFGGISLKEYAKNQPLEIKDFFAIALQILDALGELYRHGVIHKDIKPANILINPNTKKVKLIDFSIASLLPKETQVFKPANILEGTLAYLSPEQTGRMNRAIDWRSDFYSLGITFFELLTGKLPFPGNDPMELVYSHLAKSAPNPQEINPKIPNTLAKIIAKLMVKNAEERYQSVTGLQHDLQKAWDYYQQTGEIADFSLGSRDIPDRFSIPEKLYGRETEINELLSAFHRISDPEVTHRQQKCDQPEALGFAYRAVEMILVAGFSGIGKTAVVNEVHKPIARQRGYFIKGKYDQFQRNIPLDAFIQAFRSLIEQLLSESETQLQTWKTKILEALGEQAQIIIEVIPELEKIIGVQLPVAELSGSAAANRFNLLFQKFIQVFSSKDHPLVIFIDDLQWADSASLKLMEAMMGESEINNLLMIGAYRDNEVSPAHPLTLTLTEIKKHQIPVNTITLNPLSHQHINNLVADTLNCLTEQAKPLSELIYQNTKGNPFFSNQLLKSFYEEGLITFDTQSLNWQCDISQIKAATLVEDVVEFMAKQLQKLPSATQEKLKLAACIGNQFDLSTLAIVSDKSYEETAADLWIALREGLIIPIDDIYKIYQKEQENISHVGINLNHQQLTQEAPTYKFLHDRVQQAAYSLIPPSQKQKTHLKIGQLLLANIPSQQHQERIFDIVNQLNYSIKLIQTKPELQQLAELNLIAGKKAKAATAYSAAVNYFNIALASLSEESWETDYQFTLKLYEEACDAVYLSGDFDQMEMLAELVVHHGKDILDKIRIYEIKVQAYMVQNRLKESLDIALYVLQELGISFPETPDQSDIQQAFQYTASLWSEVEIADLINLPKMTDTKTLSAMGILLSVFPVAYTGFPEYISLIALKMVDLSIQQGNTDISAYGYCSYGFMLCSLFNQIDNGYSFGQLGQKVLSKNINSPLKTKIPYLYNVFIHHWKNHARESFKSFKEAYQLAIENGDIEYAGYDLYGYCFLSYLTGQELSKLASEMATYSEILQRFQQKSSLISFQIWQQSVLNLISKPNCPGILIGEAFDESVMIPFLRESNYVTAIAKLNLNKLLLNYIFGDYSVALTCAEETEKYLSNIIATINEPTLYFYESLTKIALYNEVGAVEQEKIIDNVESFQRKMHHWASHSPSNFLHKYYLVEAELHRVRDDKLAAIDNYDKSIKLAQENGYIQEEALANELAGKFYLSWDKQTIGQAYIIKAYYCYAKWGAVAKTQDLEEHYSEFLSNLQIKDVADFNYTETVLFANTSEKTLTAKSSTKVVESLDFISFIKASQAISSEIQLEALLTKLTQVLIENAGASKAVIIMPKQEKLVVEAVGISTQEQVDVLQSIPLEEGQDIPVNIINYIYRTQEKLIVNDTPTELKNEKSKISRIIDKYLIQKQPRSFICSPIFNQSKLIAILYLENDLATGVFSDERLQIINLLCSQAAISLENVRLFQQAKEYAQKADENSKQLEKSLEELKEAQLQLVQSEKMSTLGNLVSGIGHEINNPIGFLAGNLQPAQDYTQDLLQLISLYQNHYPEPVAEISQELKSLDIDYIREDLPKVLDSMKQAIDRIYDISISLRTFSRSDTDKKVPFNIHEGINSTLIILNHRLKASKVRPTIEVIKNYDDVPPIKCFPGPLNQVFMNLIANAIDALDEYNQGHSFEEIEANPNCITITTKMNEVRETLTISIKDNGPGMTAEIKERIFENLFTTKPVGKGTGLGLAIASQIVVGKHGGTIDVISSPGEGANFVISIPIT